MKRLTRSMNESGIIKAYDYQHGLEPLEKRIEAQKDKIEKLKFQVKVAQCAFTKEGAANSLRCAARKLAEMMGD